MEEPTATIETELPSQPVRERIASVDTLRGLTILLMVFVNDLGTAAPGWMHHIQPPEDDGMTLADIVFPAFLFIVGVSIPLAIDRARASGTSRLNLVGHILIRGASLLALGLIEYNKYADTTLGRPLWGLLAYTSIIMAWCVVPRERGVRRTVLIIVKSAGICALAALLICYRREPVSTSLFLYGDVDGWVWLRTGWWGILGLIGWAYLTVSLLYLVLRRREWLMGAMALLLVVYVAMDHGGFFEHVDQKNWIGPIRPAIDAVEKGIVAVNQYVSLGGTIGSLSAITMAGCLLGTILRPGGDIGGHRDRLVWGISFAGGLFVAGLVFDTFAGINKIAATPTWCLWCSALTCMTWCVIYAVMDVWKVQFWARPIQPAGANPLIAYLLHPVVIWLISMTGTSSWLVPYKSSSHAFVAVVGSVVMAAAICLLTGLIARAGLRLRI